MKAIVRGISIFTVMGESQERFATETMGFKLYSHELKSLRKCKRIRNYLFSRMEISMENYVLLQPKLQSTYKCYKNVLRMRCLDKYTVNGSK